MQIAVLGSDEFISGFRLAGVKAVYETDENEINKRIEELIELTDIGIIVLREEDYNRLSFTLKRKIDRLVSLVVITLSNEKKESLRNLIKRSIGVDLWK